MSFGSIQAEVGDVVFKFKKRVLGRQDFRRTQLYCVGMGKTGTHSLSGMFSGDVRAAHEPQATELIEKILDWREGRLSEPAMTAWLLARDRRMALEVDSAGLNYWILDFLLREFPRARFVLTVRDCYSWINSSMNHWLRHTDPDQQWIRFQDFRLGRKDIPYDAGEQILKEKGFHPLDAYFALWTKHNSEVIAKVPADRLLIVRTHEIRRRAFEIADFAGLPRRTVSLQKTHEFQNPAKQEIIRQVDRDLLERKVEQHCRPLMTRLFPEIKSLADAKL
jgi:hypothetical protein